MSPPLRQRSCESDSICTVIIRIVAEVNVTCSSLPTPVTTTTSVTETSTASTTETTSTTEISTATITEISTLTIPVTVTSTETAKATATAYSVATVTICQPYFCPLSVGSSTTGNFGSLKQDMYPECQ